MFKVYLESYTGGKNRLLRSFESLEEAKEYQQSLKASEKKYSYIEEHEHCELCGITFKVESDVEKVVYICDNCKEEEEQGDESFAI